MQDHSFAVMAYGESPYLEACLNSLKNQSVSSAIYIATSTPSTYIESIARKMDIPVFVNQQNQGIAADWNFSLQQANTKYVTLAHQDDLYLERYAELSIKAAESFHDTLICFTNYSEVADGKERRGTLLLRVKLIMLWFFMPFRKNILNPFWKKRFLSLGCPIAAPSVLYNLNNLSNFKFSSEFSINMDWDAWSRMATEKEGRFVYVNHNLLQHRIHADSATTKGLQANARQNEDLLMFKRYWPGSIAKILSTIYARSYTSNS